MPQNMLSILFTLKKDYMGKKCSMHGDMTMLLLAKPEVETTCKI